MKSDPRIRFWKFVKKTESCWIWIGTKLPSGHGRFNDGERIVLAHRFSYENNISKIPKGKCVLHHCPKEDNPSCVNPKHLWIGSRIDNNRDAMYKGQFAVGEMYKRAKLTDEKVRWIRKTADHNLALVYASGKKWGISPQSICDVIHSRTWKHIQ